MTQEALKLALEALENNKLNHLYCEDTWYSCPKHEDGCANEAEGDECNCGADEVNAQFDKAITAIKEALSQPEHKCNSHPKAPHGFNRNASHANDRYTCECESWDAYEAGYQAGVTAGIEMSTETEQKPVAWLGFNERGECREVFTPKMKETFPNYPTADMIPVYTTPPQRTWQGLTHEQVDSWELPDCPTVFEFAQFIEAKLKQKNGYAEENT